MGRFNSFGAVPADVLLLLKTGSYTPTSAEFGGDPAIQAFIDDAADDVIQMMPEAMFQSLFDVVLEKVEQRATAAQGTVTLSLKPIIDGKTHMWIGQPAMFKTKPRLRTDLLQDMVFTSPELIPLAELGPEEFSVDVDTGVVTLTPIRTIQTNDQIYATYSVDVDSPDFLVESLANVVSHGALAKMGPKFFARASSSWQFITDAKEDFDNKIIALRDGKWLPNEIRQMRFWQEVIPEADKQTSFQIGRLRRA